MDILSSKILQRNIKKYREKLGLSQDQLARKAGIPYSTYIKIESGYTLNPSIQAVVNIAQALGVSVDELLGIKRKNRCRE
jgi:transcriptional regulator with XRE-family HTH domain